MKPAPPPIVWTGATVKVIDVTDGKLTWRIIGQCLYTPRAIADTLRGAGLSSAWVSWLCGREYWALDGELAHEVKG